jgi:lysophospholipase L1-like esterase
LRDAEPGAFLDADIHMTPKGHAALAAALADALASPPELEPTKSKIQSKK